MSLKQLTLMKAKSSKSSIEKLNKSLASFYQKATKKSLKKLSLLCLKLEKTLEKV